MAFQLPEDLTALSRDELQALADTGLAEAREITDVPDADLTDEQINAAEAIMDQLATLDAEINARDAAAAERAARMAALREGIPAAETEEETEEEEPADADAEETEPVAEETPEPVVASGRKPLTSLARVARKAPQVILTDPEPTAPAGSTLVAAANVPGFQTGEGLDGLSQLAEAYVARARGFAAGGAKGSKALKPGLYPVSGNAQRYGVGRLRLAENEFSTSETDSVQRQFDVIMAAAKEKRLPGGSLTAAGGWCAPSERLWDFCGLEQAGGLLSIPEVTASRGGIVFTRGPQLSDILALTELPFRQTEAEAEAGTEKVCITIECPDWEEVRLDAVGFCLNAGILTNAAYPELIRRYLELIAIGFDRAINAATIAEIVAAVGTPVDHAEIGATTSDVFDALSIQAARIRWTYSMSPEATIEVILPFWAREVLRSDLSRRTGVDMLMVTDQQIDSYLSARHLSVQYVYDFQDISSTNTGTWTSWPDTLQAILYPAGSFVRLTNDVIDLDTIYDSVGLSTNTYTAAFFEQGFAVANTCGGGVAVTIDVSCLAGRTGAADVTCAVV